MTRKEWRQKRIEAGICVDCGKPSVSKRYCANCLYKRAARMRIDRIENPEKYHARDRATRERRRNNNQCVICGRPDSYPECDWCKCREH